MIVQAEAAGAPSQGTGTMEQQYWAWTNDRRRAYDFLSMLGSMLLATSCLVSHYSGGGVPDQLFISAMKVMQAVSCLAAIMILMRKQVFFFFRDVVMAIMWYSLCGGVLNTFPFLDRGLQRADPWQAFLSICCHRWVGLAMGSLAWRVQISRVPSVSFGAMLLCALGAVRAAKAYAERGSGNLYMQFLCTRLNASIQSACTGVAKAAAVFMTGQKAAGGLSVGMCQSAEVTQRHTVLLIWLFLHALAFWVGFSYHLRDEISDRKAFLVTHMRGRSVTLCAPSVKPMVLLMIAIQVYVFALLLLFGDSFV